MKIPNPQEIYFTFLVLCLCTISSGLTYIGVKGVYRELHTSELERTREDNISVIMMNKRLQQCAYQFGVYVATKGKYGLEYFEEHHQLSRRGMAVSRPKRAPGGVPDMVGD